MHVTFFSARTYEHAFFVRANRTHGHELVFLDVRLGRETASLAAAGAVCAFVNDILDRPVLERLVSQGVRLVALRCAGFNNVDLLAAAELGLPVARVPAYSPSAVAEHTTGMILSLNRKIHRAYARVREGNFSLDGLLGFDLRGRTVGVVGTGRIGATVVRIMRGFDCRVLAYDIVRDPDCEALGARYVTRDELLAGSDIVTLHCPLVPDTHHLIDAATIPRMKPGVMLINTSRGGLVDTRAIIDGLKSGQIGYLGLDVYEEEADLFFEDLSNAVIKDDVFSRLLTFPNVLITGHQGFFTADALQNISDTTLRNITSLEATGRPEHPVDRQRYAVEGDR